MSFTFNQQGGFKSAGSATYPIQVVGDSGNVSRVGPLVTPEDLRRTYLFGLPLVSPLTKQALNNEDLKVIINRALNEAEMALNISIVETVRETRSPYDRRMVDYWWFLELPFRPITAINQMTIQDSSGVIFYVVPPVLLETQNCHLGQLSIGFSSIPAGSPILADGQYSNAAAVLFKNLATFSMPGYWTTQYVTGWPLDKIPSPVNQLIGCIAAMDVLSMIGPILRPNNSSSLNLDGLGQSVSGPGPAWLQNRLQELATRKAELTDQIKSYYYNQIIVSNF